MTVDTSKLADVEDRMSAARLQNKWADAHDKWSEHECGGFSDSVRVKLDALDAEYDARRSAILGEIPEHAEDDRLKAAIEQAQSELEALNLPSLMLDGDSRPIICARSGLPVWREDEILEDPVTEQVVLRCFTGLPPRETEEMEDAA